MRGATHERKLVRANVEALVTSAAVLNARLNAGKHASVGDEHTARMLLMAVEAVLTALLAEG